MTKVEFDLSFRAPDVRIYFLGGEVIIVPQDGGVIRVGRGETVQLTDGIYDYTFQEIYASKKKNPTWTLSQK